MVLPLTRYGRGELVATTFALVALSVAMGLAVPWSAPLPVFLLLFLLYFFRDPERSIPSDAGAIVAPADGTVTDIGECEEPQFLNGRSLRIGIFLSVFNVHVNRSPVAGRVAYLGYRPGRFLSALRESCARENESNSVGLVTDAVPGGRVLVRQVAGMIAQRIVCDCRIDGALDRGQRFGMIKLGSRTELYLPARVPLEIRVKVGDKVKGGETILVVASSGGH